MRIEYERACVEAGLPEEKIKEIRRIFDADYKRLKRRNEAVRRDGIDYLSLESIRYTENDFSAYCFANPVGNVEEIVFHRLDLERLCEVLERIPAKDKEFILDCFDAQWGSQKKVAEKYGVTVGYVKLKKIRVIEKIRTLFFENER